MTVTLRVTDPNQKWDERFGPNGIAERALCLTSTIDLGVDNGKKDSGDSCGRLVYVSLCNKDTQHLRQYHHCVTY